MNKRYLLFFLVIGLAAFGLLTQLFTRPGSLFATIFITLAIGAVISFVFYFIFMRNRTPSNEMKKYRKAVRQSKAKYNHGKVEPKAITKKQPSLIRKKRRQPTHLRVIEGNKTKGKDRASF